MTTRPSSALNESVARDIVGERRQTVPTADLPAALAVDLAKEILARGGWKANTCAPLLRAYEIAAASDGGVSRWTTEDETRAELADGRKVPQACVQALDELDKRWPGATLPQARAAIAAAVLAAAGGVS